MPLASRMSSTRRARVASLDPCRICDTRRPSKHFGNMVEDAPSFALRRGGRGSPVDRDRRQRGDEGDFPASAPSSDADPTTIASPRLLRTASQFVMEALQAGPPVDEIPWGGSRGDGGVVDDDEPAAVPPAPFAWGADDAETTLVPHDREERGARDGRKMKESATRYRAMGTAGARRDALASHRRHSYGWEGSEQDVGEGTDPEEAAAAEARRAAEAAAAAEDAPRRALEEARAILADRNAEDEDLLRPAEEREWIDEEEKLKRLHAAGDSENLLSAWGVPPLQPTEADLAKQKVYERVHRTQFRKRNAAHNFGDPDEIDELVLDVDRAEREDAARRKEMERRRDDSRNTAAAAEAESFALPAVELPPKVPATEPRDRGGGSNSRVGYLTPATGGFLNIVLGEDRVAAATTAADKGSNNPEAAAIRAKLEKAPPHLRAYMQPRELELPVGAQVVKISGGYEHAAILLKTSSNLERVLPKHQDNEGRVLMLGSGEHGQLGLGDNRLQTVPVVLSTLSEFNGDAGGGRVRVGGDRLGGRGCVSRRAVDVAAGEKHTVVVTEEHDAAAFGTDTEGNTGQGESGRGKMHRLPRWLYWVSNDTTRVVACAAGRAHTALLTATRHVLTMGEGSRGKLGHGNVRSQLKPRRVEALLGVEVTSISAGWDHTLCITDSGLLYGWGANESGQLGTGDAVDRTTPSRVTHEEWLGGAAYADTDDEPEKRTLDLQERILGPLHGKLGRFLSVSEAERPFAQPTEQQLAAAVKAREEALGIQQQPTDEELRLRMGIRESKSTRSRVVQACGGRAHTVVLTEAGLVYTCGASDHGELGQGDRLARSKPTNVSTMVNLSAVQVAAGESHTALLTSLGHVYVCGGNTLGQLGDGTLDDCLEFKCLQPVASEKEMRKMSTFRLEALLQHPMYGVTCEQVYTSGASVFAVASGGERVFVCGSGAFGNPHDRNPTDFSMLLREPLDDRESKKAMVMESTVRMLRPDDQGFLDLVRQMVLYSLYNERVLSHVMKVMLEEVLRKPGFVVMYGALLERLAKMCLECPIAHFRRVILLAIEDMGVQLLQAQDEALQRRMLQKMGWAKYQQTQREGAGGVGAGNQMTYYGMITDKASYEDFKHFRDDCKSLQGFVRELFEVQKILLEDDVRDLAAAFPGSRHSIGVADSEQAQKKMTFFRSLSRWKSPGERAAELAERAAGVSATTMNVRLVKEDDADTVRQRGLMSNKPVPSRGADEAAWDHSEDTGWEAYRIPEEIKPEEGAGWIRYLERQRREAKFKSPVVTPDEEDNPVAATREAEGLDEVEIRELRKRREAERAKKRVGLNGMRIVESTLAASFHPDNRVMSAGRDALENNMARRLGGAATAVPSAMRTSIAGADLTTRRVKLEEKLASMAASGESVERLERYRYMAETNPLLGYCTQEEVDSAAPAQQAEWKRLAFKFSRVHEEKVAGTEDECVVAAG